MYVGVSPLVVHEELVALKTGVLSKNTQRHSLAYVEIVSGVFSLQLLRAAVECLSLKLLKCLRLYGIEVYLLVLG